MSARNSEKLLGLENYSYSFGMFFGEPDPNGCACSDYFPDVVRIKRGDLKALKKQVNTALADISAIQKTILKPFDVKAKLAEVLCGEVDPMVIGDACVLKLVPYTKVQNRYIRSYNPKAIYMIVDIEQTDRFEALEGKTVLFSNSGLQSADPRWDKDGNQKNETVLTLESAMGLTREQVVASKFFLYEGSSESWKIVR